MTAKPYCAADALIRRDFNKRLRVLAIPRSNDWRHNEVMETQMRLRLVGDLPYLLSRPGRWDSL